MIEGEPPFAGVHVRNALERWVLAGARKATAVVFAKAIKSSVGDDRQGVGANAGCNCQPDAGWSESEHCDLDFSCGMQLRQSQEPLGEPQAPVGASPEPSLTADCCGGAQICSG